MARYDALPSVAPLGDTFNLLKINATEGNETKLLIYFHPKQLSNWKRGLKTNTTLFDGHIIQIRDKNDKWYKGFDGIISIIKKYILGFLNGWFGRIILFCIFS